MRIDSRLYAVAYEIAARVHDGTFAARDKPMAEIYPQLIAELAHRCPGFSNTEYTEALAYALHESAF